MKIAIIGAGNMGGAIARGLCRGTQVKAEEITVSNPSQGKLDALRSEHPRLNITNDNRQAATGADLILLAVKPWFIEQVIKEIQPTPQQIVVSVAAGINFARLAEFCGHPGQTLFRVVPNTAVSLMESLTPIASCNATPEQEQQLLAIFNEMGLAVLLPESKIPAATSLTSCGIAYVLKYIQAAMQAGVELGIPAKDSMTMVAQTMKGAAEIILAGQTHPSVEIDKVCTPGGITIKGINALEHAGFSSAIIKAIKESTC